MIPKGHYAAHTHTNTHTHNCGYYQVNSLWTYIQGFGQKTQRMDAYMIMSTQVRIISKCIFKKKDGKMSNGYTWLRKETSNRIL
jgi:hypothetical protein